MANLPEVPTEELLSFQDYPTVHSSGNSPNSSAQLNLTVQPDNFESFHSQTQTAQPLDDNATSQNPSKSFWTLEYYQQFFDVDTKDVVERIIASITPRRDNTLKYHLREKPDLYGPFWISVTLIFTIAISGNVANYFQHQYHWKYDFHLVSYAATAIYTYVLFVPFALWALLKWSSDVNDLEGLESGTTPGTLELICIYGYSLFIYIPVSILWTIPINLLQWLLVLIGALVSGSVLLFTLLPALRLSRHKFVLMIGISSCHLLLAAGFMLYFFHVPYTNNTPVIEHETVSAITHNLTKTTVKSI